MFLLPTLLAALLARAIAVTVRPPTTRYGVDSRAMELIDASRPDPYAAANGLHEPRRLMVSIFEPSCLQHHCQQLPERYMPPATAAVYDTMYDQYGLPDGVFGSLELSFCRQNNSHGQVDLGATFPVALFSPGLGNSRLEYSGIAYSLASRGFTVITIDHPYDANIVEYPDGSYILAANITTNAQIEFDLNVRVADVSFVLDQLNTTILQDQTFNSLGRPKEHSDPQHYVMYGHSLGGATAIASMAQDPRIFGAANLDGSLWGSVLNHGVSCPMMLFGRPNHTLATDSTWEATWRNSPNATRLELGLARSAHGTFTDFPLLLDAVGVSPATAAALAPLIGSLPGKEVNDILSTYLQDFFSFARGTSADPLPLQASNGTVVILQRSGNSTCQ